VTAVVAAIGDLISDVVVELHAGYRSGTDTEASIVRRRGGSAANVAAAVVAGGGVGRFIGNVGDDTAGAALIGEMEAAGVQLAVSRGGSTGTVIAIVDQTGERSLLTDRGSSADLASLPDNALGGVGALHVPLYALMVEPLASTVADAIHLAVQAGVLVSVDASSIPVIEHVGAAALVQWCVDRQVDVLFCNHDEATAIGRDQFARLPVVVEKRGAEPAQITSDGNVRLVNAVAVETVADTTGAGDAFAAGTLVARAAGADWTTAVASGHRLAARAVRQLGALTGAEL
jgi:sugar/nucleoside kinase (ribokinase family)